MQILGPEAWLQSSVEPQPPSALSFPSAVPSSRWSTSSPKSGAWRWSAWQGSLRTREGHTEGQPTEPVPRDDFWGHKQWMTLIARHFRRMRLQLKAQLQSTFKNSLLYLKRDNRKKNNNIQIPVISLCQCHTCLPGTVPIICPSKQPCACSWEVSYLPRGCVLPSGSAMCTVSSHLCQGAKFWNIGSLKYVIWISK